MTTQELKPEAALESWKAIASHLKRDVRTVKRWERREGLPVRRHLHLARATVYAYPSELDAWWAGRSPQLSAGAPSLRSPLAPRLGLAAALRTWDTVLHTPWKRATFSPDGRAVAYDATVGARSQVFLIDLASIG